MRTTIDSAGRIVLPEAIRAAAGLEPGAPLIVRFVDGRIEIEAALEIDFVQHGGVSVAMARGQGPVLDADIVEATQFTLRRDRH